MYMYRVYMCVCVYKIYVYAYPPPWEKDTQLGRAPICWRIPPSTLQGPPTENRRQGLNPGLSHGLQSPQILDCQHCLPGDTLAGS